MEAAQSFTPQSLSASAPDNNGAYILRDLIRDVPLSESGDDDERNVYITCVEAWGSFLSTQSIFSACYCRRILTRLDAP